MLVEQLLQQTWNKRKHKKKTITFTLNCSISEIGVPISSGQTSVSTLALLLFEEATAGPVAPATALSDDALAPPVDGDVTPPPPPVPLLCRSPRPSPPPPPPPGGTPGLLQLWWMYDAAGWSEVPDAAAAAAAAAAGVIVGVGVVTADGMERMLEGTASVKWTERGGCCWWWWAWEDAPPPPAPGGGWPVDPGPDPASRSRMSERESEECSGFLRDSPRKRVSIGASSLSLFQLDSLQEMAK